ncbi:MAG: hypothetical protein Kow0069_35770 [Promethearchaeota archaeon]
MFESKKVATLVLVALAAAGFTTGLFARPLIDAWTASSGTGGSGSSGGSGAAENVKVYVAPYVSQTHPCYTHVVGGCTGEFADQKFSVVLRSGDDSVNFQGDVTTDQYGFAALELPANKSYEAFFHAEISGTNYEAYSQFATYDDSPNCVTTAHLLEKSP